uniref:Uncharacterized protein n=1 Tax=Arundo donax TaxID=35708 RepID=A0A0A8ZPQ9_ARUDO
MVRSRHQDGYYFACSLHCIIVVLLSTAVPSEFLCTEYLLIITSNHHMNMNHL